MELSQSRLDRMSDVMAGYVSRGEIPGLVTLVSRRGEVHASSYGVTALGGDVPVSRHSIFRISSMTKPVTAVATMILVEECLLRLDEPVDRLLPELADRQVLKDLDGPLEDTVPAHRPITVRDLLTFTLGFGMVMAAPGSTPLLRAMSSRSLGQGPPEPGGVPPPDEWIKALGSLPLMYQPGERWQYNTGSEILSVLVARASGQPFEVFLRSRIFEPLGMKDTGFFVPSPDLGRLVTAYWSDPSSGQLVLADPAAGGQWSRMPAFPSGASGLVSTVDDFLAFGQMLLDKGRYPRGRLLSRPAVELMTSDQLTPAQKAISGIVPGYFESHGWGFGMSVSTRRDELWGTVGRFGWDGGMGTSWYSDPSEEMVTVLMTQRAWTSPAPPPICRDFWTLAYQAIND